jgi:hypothetical protein
MEPIFSNGSYALALGALLLALVTVFSNTMREFLLFSSLRAAGAGAALVVKAVMLGAWRLLLGVGFLFKVWIVYTVQSVQVIWTALRQEWR